MSVQALGEALKQKDIGPTQRLVLIYLADRMNFHYGQMSQTAWPSVSTLARDTGLSKRTVQRSIRLLEEKGLISIGPLEGGRVEYLWLLSKKEGEYVIPKTSKRGCQELTRGDTQSPGGARESPGGCHSVTHYKNHKDNHKEEQERARKRATRLSEDWTLPEDWKTWAENEGCESPEKAADKFRDYWIAASGQKATKTNWLATWRNWIRGDIERAQPTNGETKPWKLSDDQLLAAALAKGISTGGKTRQQLINALG